MNFKEIDKMLTNEQKEAIDNVLNRDFSLYVIKAFAGSGKTFLLKQIALRYQGSKILLAYNKSIEQEAKRSFKGTGTEVYTTHGFALRYLLKKGYELKGNFSPLEIANLLGVEYKEAVSILFLLENFCNSDRDKVVSNPKSVIEKKTIELWELMQNKRVGLTFASLLKVFEQLLKQGKIEIETEMIFLDEAQDTNDVTVSIFNSIKAKKKIIVGDTHQQLYAFRGANDALSKITSPSKKVLYLTNSFRFTQDIADKATCILALFREEEKPVKGLYKPQQKKEKTEAYISRTFLSIVNKIDELIPKKKPFIIVRDLENVFRDQLELLDIISGCNIQQHLKYSTKWKHLLKKYHKMNNITSKDIDKYSKYGIKEIFELLGSTSNKEQLKGRRELKKTLLANTKTVNIELAKEKIEEVITKNKNVTLKKVFNEYKSFFTNFNKEELTSLQNLWDEFLAFAREEAEEANDREVLALLKSVSFLGNKIFQYYTIAKKYLKEYKKTKRKQDFIFLTTAHSSKGLEWDKVEIEDDFGIIQKIGEWFAKNTKRAFEDPLSYFAKNCDDSQLINEINLYYVAVTRGQETVIDQTELNFLENPSSMTHYRMQVNEKLNEAIAQERKKLKRRYD